MVKTKRKPTRPTRNVIISREALDAVLRFGTQMSNTCFNWKQDTANFDAGERKMLDEMQRGWDAATIALSKSKK